MSFTDGAHRPVGITPDGVRFTVAGGDHDTGVAFLITGCGGNTGFPEALPVDAALPVEGADTTPTTSAAAATAATTPRRTRD